MEGVRKIGVALVASPGRSFNQQASLSLCPQTSKNRFAFRFRNADAVKRCVITLVTADPSLVSDVKEALLYLVTDKNVVDDSPSVGWHLSDCFSISNQS